MTSLKGQVEDLRAAKRFEKLMSAESSTMTYMEIHSILSKKSEEKFLKLF